MVDADVLSCVSGLVVDVVADTEVGEVGDVVAGIEVGEVGDIEVGEVGV